MMLRIAVDVTGAVCGTDCSMRLRNASTRWRSVAVVNPLHAGDAEVSRDRTTARKTACRPISSCGGAATRAVTDNSTDMF